MSDKTMWALLRKDLRGKGLTPPTFFECTSREIDWDNEAFECEEPDEIEDDEFNLVLRGEEFDDNLEFACTIDFDFYHTKEQALNS